MLNFKYLWMKNSMVYLKIVLPFIFRTVCKFWDLFLFVNSDLLVFIINKNFYIYLVFNWSYVTVFFIIWCLWCIIDVFLVARINCSDLVFKEWINYKCNFYVSILHRILNIKKWKRKKHSHKKRMFFK